MSKTTLKEIVDAVESAPAAAAKKCPPNNPKC